MARPRRIGPKPKYAHTSLYLDAGVMLHVRALAEQRGCKQNDLLLEGLDLLLEKYGSPSIDELLKIPTDHMNRVIHGIPAREGRGDAPAIKSRRVKETAPP